MMSIRVSPLRAVSFGLCAVALLALGALGCGAKSGSSGKTTGGTSAAGTTDTALAIGFLYVGPKDDYGYNQAQAQGAAEVKKMPGVKVVEAENIPESIDAQKVMKRMVAQDGTKLIFPTSYNYFRPHTIEMAKKYPEVLFIHCGGVWEPKDPKNVGTYFGYIDECEYISGIVAGYATQSKKLGFVAAKPIPQVRRNINAFTMGARSVDPKITVKVIFTGDWSMPAKEAEATNTLIDQGIDVITCHVDSPKVLVEAAEKRNCKVCGYHASQASIAPKGYLTGAEWNWGKVFTGYVKMMQDGKALGEDHNLRGGMKEGIVQMSPYTSQVTPEARKAADAVKDQLMQGTFVIFKGPLMDNTGKTVIPAGTSYPQKAPQLESMDYLVEGVIGS
jgi:basic membrane protein A and related proteins